MFALVKKIGSQAEPCDRQRFHEIIDDTQVSLICKKIFLAMVIPCRQNGGDTQAHQE